MSGSENIVESTAEAEVDVETSSDVREESYSAGTDSYEEPKRAKHSGASGLSGNSARLQSKSEQQTVNDQIDTTNTPQVDSVSAMFTPFDEEWSSTTRSIRIDGTVTSVRLENFFWRILGGMAQEQGLQIPQLLTRLSKVARSGETRHSNFTSFIRVCCGRFIDRQLPGNQVPAQAAGMEARTDNRLTS